MNPPSVDETHASAGRVGRRILTADADTVGTGTGMEEARGGTALAAECREVLDWARARVDELVGV
ncbi:hypothetical protein BST29_24625, partial [Mycobacterium malmoense]